MRVSEFRVKQIRVNQGLGVLYFLKLDSRVSFFVGISTAGIIGNY